MRKGETGKRAAVFTAVLVVGLVLSLALDHRVFQLFQSHPPDTDGDLYRMFRVMGYLPTWLILGFAFYLVRPRVEVTAVRHMLWSFAPFYSALLSGSIASLSKMVFRRERQDVADWALYVFRPFSEGPLKASGLSMPSEHTAVAFGAACMLARMFPRARPVFFLLAVGCGLSRLTYADHYLSDVFVAAMLGYATTWTLVRCFGKRD